MAEKKHLTETLEELGEARVKAMLETNQWTTRRERVIEWLRQKELQREGEQGGRDERLVRAAEQSAESAAASANWAKWAAVVALLSVIVTVAMYLSAR